MPYCVRSCAKKQKSVKQAPSAWVYTSIGDILLEELQMVTQCELTPGISA